MSAKPEATPLPVEEPADLLIALLYSPGKSGEPGEPISGTTRLQKLFFLLREGEGPKALVAEARALPFEAYKMGPYSTELRDIVADLQAADIVDVEQLDYVLPDDDDESSEGDRAESQAGGRRVSSYRYRLTPELGTQIGQDLWAGFTDELRKDLTEFKRFFNAISLRQLLIFTYEKFPRYTTRSTIKEQLGIYDS